jgi:hypothetical protein
MIRNTNDTDLIGVTRMIRIDGVTQPNVYIDVTSRIRNARTTIESCVTRAIRNTRATVPPRIR